MQSPKPVSRAALCAQNCGQVAYILSHKTREDREQVAADQLREASAVIDSLINALGAVKATLTVPAAEYVPAIPDAWAIIDAALAHPSHQAASAAATNKTSSTKEAGE